MGKEGRKLELGETNKITFVDHATTAATSHVSQDKVLLGPHMGTKRSEKTDSYLKQISNFSTKFKPLADAALIEWLVNLES